MDDLKYTEANDKSPSRVPKDTDVIGCAAPTDGDQNQGMTLLQLKEYVNGTSN